MNHGHHYYNNSYQSAEAMHIPLPPSGPHHNKIPSLQQSKSAPSHFGTEFSHILGSLNHDLLDDFQIQLFQLLQNASTQNIASYFQKKSNIFYRFIITLYICSLDKSHPVRKNNHLESDTFKEFHNAFTHTSKHQQSASLSSNHSVSISYDHNQPQPPMAFFNPAIKMQSAPVLSPNNNTESPLQCLPNLTPILKKQDSTQSNSSNSTGPTSPPSLNNIHNNTFQAPSAHNISFDVSKNAQPPSKNMRKKQYNIQSKNNNKKQRSHNSLNNILSAPNHRVNRPSFAQQFTNSKSAQALKNVVNKKKRKMKGLPEIEEVKEKEKIIFVETAEIIAPMTIVHGKIRITNKSISFIPDIEQKSDKNLALNPPNLQQMDADEQISFMRADAEFKSTRGEDDKYWVAVNVASSYEQVGGTRYKLMNAKNIWNINEVTEIYYRRYQARNCAFELFFNDDTSWLFNVFKEKYRDIIFDAIIDSKYATNLIDETSVFKNPKKAIKSSKIHHKWCTREISNFEYIMRINLLAGRTFNDLEQYPVVPWIIKEYESNEIDLKNPKIYRDLTKPIGACNVDRLKKFVERYECMVDDPDNRFMYGTHYSTKAVVLFFLIRMEPFTTYNKMFQGGKFDTADRLFDSIQKTFRGCMRSTSDVKELIPEFYYMTDFLINKDKLDLGVKQHSDKKERVNHVILPPWSGGSYEFFTKTMRNAFESEYVSRNLHHWIDLIFGYKQSGKDAELAHNVFHPYTYQENVDLDAITDENEKEVILQIISEFGQTPMKIFKKPHRVRLKGTQVVQNIYKAKSIKFYGSFVCVEGGHIGISYMAMRTKGDKNDKKNIITISTDNTVDVHKFDEKTFTITKEEKKKSSLNVLFHRNNNKQWSNFHGGVVKNQIIKKQSNNLFLKNLCFAITQDGDHLFACGFEDCSFIQYIISQEKIEHEFHNHSNIVSCLALDENDRKNKIILVTGSYDKSIIVWKGKQSNYKNKHNRSISANYYQMKNNDSNLSISQVYTKTKHDSEINCVDIAIEKGIVIVGCKSGSIYMYNLSKGNTLWSTNISSNIAICRVSKTFGSVLCYVCNYDNKPAKLFLFNNAGNLLNQHVLNDNDKYHEISFSKSGNNVCCGGLNKSIIIYNLPSFNILRQLNDSNDVIRHVFTDKDERYIIAALSNGNVLLYSYPESAQKITPKLPHRKSLYGIAGNAKKNNPFQLK